MNEWTQVAGWVLVHFLWEGSVLAFAAAALLRFCRDGSANLRYVIACTSLAAMLAAPLATAFVLASRPAPPSFVSVSAFVGADRAAATSAGSREVLRDAQETLGRKVGAVTLERYFPVVVSVWLVGVAALLLHSLHGWYHIHRLHRAALTLAPSSWQQPSDCLARRLALRSPVRVVELKSIDVPTVVGWMRPVILLPVAAIAQLPASQIEAVLAHELAHIRRHDYLVNLLQRVAEAALFYHPAIWWISARVRDEREHCCDDVAIALCGDRDGYAAALTELEQLRTTTARIGLAATGGQLLSRIRRILQLSPPDRFQGPSWALTLAIVALFALVVGGPQRSPTLLAQARSTVADALPPSFKAGWDDVTGGGSITSTGTVVFTPDLRDLKSIADGGSLTIRTRRLLSSRRVEIHASNGAVDRKLYVNDVEQPWTQESAQWLADELPFLVRRSGIAAGERVEQLLLSGGVNGVLDEITLLYTDSVRSRYFRALFETGRLDAIELDTSFKLAANVITSSMELARALRAAHTAGFWDHDGFFYAASRITSSMEKSHLLTEVLHTSDLTPARQVAFATATRTIESSAARAAVLEAFALRYPSGNATAAPDAVR